MFMIVLFLLLCILHIFTYVLKVHEVSYIRNTYFFNLCRK